MRKMLWIASLLLSDAACGARAEVAQTKGETKVYELDGFRLHVYRTFDAMDDTSFVVEGREGLVVLEAPLFKENQAEFGAYLRALGKPVVKVVADYHVAGLADYAAERIVLVEGMDAFAEGAVYGGLLEGFATAFGDAIDARKHTGHRTVPASGCREWAGLTFEFVPGASSDFPAASIRIGGQVCYTHFAPARAHFSPLQLPNRDAVGAQLEASKDAAASGCTLFVGGHGALAGLAEAEFQVAYLEKLQTLLAVCADADALAAALAEAYPGLPGDPAALAAALYN